MDELPQSMKEPRTRSVVLGDANQGGKNDSGDGEETHDLGSFNFQQNLKADIGCSFTEGKYFDEGLPYKSFLEEKGIDKIHITKAEYFEKFSNRTNKMRDLGQSIIAQFS